jgi:hypothetical protein
VINNQKNCPYSEAILSRYNANRDEIKNDHDKNTPESLQIFPVLNTAGNS